ncbi:acyl-CoA N-acyltransferase [Xylaria sp. CBS 124048]|nr:acyl-CoA N-acyltransferase [Xylaria sp. CBS 124048]
MSLSSVCLPDGRSYTVQPAFGGFFFKNDELNVHPTPFPVGWTIALHTEEAIKHDPHSSGADDDDTHAHDDMPRFHQHPFRGPTLMNDAIYISSISHSSSGEYKPHTSSSRQIALMLWVSLYWYFQQAQPAPHLHTERSKATPLEAKPRGEWRIRIACEGVFRNRNMIPELERMGLVTNFDTSVDNAVDCGEQEFDQVFVTRRAFWQIHDALFLVTLQPLKSQSSHPGSPVDSPPRYNTASPESSSSAPHCPSQMPTYYPPPPLQYTMTNNIRHPRRQKPPRMGEIFYSRFIPSVGKHLSFRVASLSSKPVPIPGLSENPGHLGEYSDLCTLSDRALLQRWLSNPRVSAFWGQYHDNFLSDVMKAQHTFPAIGLWDGVPFGYFEIYWVKEDLLGQLMGGDAQDFDRGLHVLIGEEWARGKVAAVSCSFPPLIF